MKHFFFNDIKRVLSTEIQPKAFKNKIGIVTNGRAQTDKTKVKTDVDRTVRENLAEHTRLLGAELLANITRAQIIQDQ